MENSPERQPRQRILAQADRLPAIVDEMVYSRNKCSGNARQILTINEKLSVEIWFDKHYIDREQFGDENGRRDGIERETVKSLIAKSFKHLLTYAAHLKYFSFVNHEPLSGRAQRIVLQERIDDILLNVPIEVHYVNMSKYELTVKTAMWEDGFDLGDGQFALEIDGDESFLRQKQVRGGVILICSL